MPHLPARFAGTILSFAPLFVHRSWRHAQALLIGTILCPGRQTVASVLRITGRVHDRHFVNTHRVLSRAAWSLRSAARILLRLLVEAFVPHGPVMLALDDTIERRWGRRIQARGIYRDPVRSSGAHFVKTSGLRLMSLMLLAPIPWAGRVWALPFLTALVPSERASRERGHRHKTLLDVGRQMALEVRRGLPGRDLVLVGDSAFSALLFLDALRRGGVTAITRLRLDAALYDPAPPRLPSTIGRPRKNGTRRSSLSEILNDPGTLPTLDDGKKTWPSLRLAMLDGAFTAERCQEWCLVHGMRHRVVEKQPDQKGFVVLERRWVVERTFGWLSDWGGLHRERAGRLDVVKGHLACVASLMAANALNNPA